MKKDFKFRPSTLAERQKFYDNEFSVREVDGWFGKNEIKMPKICAVDAGSETGIMIDKKLKNKMLYFPFPELKEKIKKYVPEDVYYDRNIYKNPAAALKKLNFSRFTGQELVFDIDSDNIPCRNHKRERVCLRCLRKAYFQTLRLKKYLSKYFKRMIIVYSGRGFHLHVLDEKAYKMSFSGRKRLNEELKDFPIDEWVSAGHISLIRIPGSLNSLVSRKVVQMKKSGKNLNLGKSIPKFIKN